MIVYTELEKRLSNILNNEDEDWLIYKEEQDHPTVEMFLNEQIQVAKQMKDLDLKIKDIQCFYECDEDKAILMYRFTDAYDLMKGYEKISNI